ncbi:Tetratricopeptide repeat family protein [Giardia duodenalis]|uniref:Tetratricopeptide repeat family protein n=1 Tax=Giardia intestinalis TaxID=5741 RepID=V6TMS1_GIAIN|nr:Tetratricopeptide repeat family protein [Giardia intestinalis]
MCQPVHRLVWTGDSLCPSATSVLRCRRSHSQAQTRLGGEPLTARPQGSPLIWQPGASSRREGRPILGRCCCGPPLTTASCSAAQTRFCYAAPTQSCSRPQRHSHPRRQRRTVEPEGHSRRNPHWSRLAPLGGQRLWWARCEGQGQSHSQVGPQPSTVE